MNKNRQIQMQTVFLWFLFLAQRPVKNQKLNCTVIQTDITCIVETVKISEPTQTQTDLPTYYLCSVCRH